MVRRPVVHCLSRVTHVRCGLLYWRNAEWANQTASKVHPMMEDRLKHALQLMKEAEEILRQCAQTKDSPWQTMSQVWKANVTHIVKNIEKHLNPIGPF